MRAGWEGNDRLQDYVRRIDSGAELIAEVVAVEGYDTKHTQAEWAAGAVSGGTRSVLDSGGARLTAAESTLAEQTTDDATDTTRLTPSPTFDAIVVDHLGNGAESREFHTLTARLDPRADGGQPKTVDHWIAEAYRIYRRVEPDNIYVELIARSSKVDATGEVAADFDFALQAVSGRYPDAGLPPEWIEDEPGTPDGGPQRPQTLFRIIAFRADGSPADNVSWVSDSTTGGSITDSSTYIVTHYSVIDSTVIEGARTNGSVFELGGIVTNTPRFSLTRTTYTAATITFNTASTDIDDISGTGDLRIVARGEEWGDSSLTWEIWDGTSAWVECVDGDILGQNNETVIEGTTYGSDLSSIPTTGPWDIRVTLTPSTSNLRSPVAIEFGIERISITSLAGAAKVEGGGQSISDLTTLVAEVAAATVRIPKTGEKDYRDYGSELIVANHIGDIEVRVWVGDPTSEYLHRSEWMLHSVWDLDDYGATDADIVLDVLSPLRRASIPIPPFVVTSGNDGTRKAVTVSGTRKAAFEELLDSLIALPARFRGPGVEDTTNTVSKVIRESDALDELNRIAFLDGEAVVESQGRIKAVKVMRDEPIDYIVMRYPLGTYDIRGRFGPGFGTRLDEYFVRYNWEDTEERFDNERRFVNATAFDKLGGAGLFSETRLDDETCKWISTQALADAVGDRIPKHFGNGQIVWQIRAHDGYRNPALELGDVVLIETDLFAARSPINSAEIRGPLTAVAIVVGADPWGQNLDLWVPGFEYIAVGTGTVTIEVGPVPWVQATDELYSIGVSSGNQGWKRRLVLICGPGTKSVNIQVNDYIETLGIDDAGYPSQNVTGWNYDLDVTPNTTVHHVLQDSSGSSDAVQVVRYDEGNLLPGGRTFSVTITPYSEASAAGIAGRAVTVLTKDFDSYDFVGFRTTETMDRRVDNNDTPGLGGFDLDLDNTANGFAFEWTNNEGESVDISQVRFYLKATGSPTGTLSALIYADSAGLPTGAALATSTGVAASGIGAAYEAVTFDFPTPETVAASTTVHVAIQTGGGTASDYISVEAEDAGSHSELNGSWAAGAANRSLLWRLYVEDEVERFARRAIPTGSLSASLNTSTGELELSG